MSKRRFSLRRLFSNTKFLIVFSLAVAFVFWIIVALEYAPIVENQIKNVPVTIDLENSVPDKLGLQIFGQKDFSVDITVKGNRYIVGGDLIDANDFEVTAQTAYVNSAGNHMLQVKVTAKDADSDFEIVSVSSDYIDVYFDKYEEKDVNVSPRIITELNSITDGDYLFNEKDIIISTKSVHISGAKTEVDRIEEAYVDINIDKKLTESETLDTFIVLDNGTGEETKYVKINGETSLSVPVTLPVYRLAELPLSVTFRNAPPEYISNPINYTCRPSCARLAILRNGTSESETFSLGTIDFSEIIPGRTVYEFKASELQNVKVLDGTKTFTVTLDTSGLESKTFELKSEAVTFASDAGSLYADTSATKEVTVIGRPENLEKITAEDITGTVSSDMTKPEINSEVPVTLSLRSDNCWIVGEYNVIVKSK